MHPSRPNRRRVAVAAAATLTAALAPVIGTATTASAAATDVFISEYVEGSSNNKALEIYNGTGSPIDLAAGRYSIQMFFNGNTAPGLTINLTGTVASGDVHVLAQAAANAAVLAQADQTNGSGWYNGDDAVVLRRDGAVLDVIGQIGVDPGSEWGTGLASTADNTLRREGSLDAGDPDGSNAFDPSGEWDGYPTDTFGALGAHPAGDVAPLVTGILPAAGATSVSVTENLTVTFSEPVTASAAAFGLTCSGGPVPLTVSGGPTSFTLDPDATLPSGAECSLAVNATGVSDTDTIDPPDAPAANRTSTFTTLAGDPCTVPATAIPAIQGSGSAAAITGVVTTRGVVVGDHEGPSPALRGFYLQDAEGDGNAQTSDGIFVFGGNNDRVKVGDAVSVVGTAAEFQDQTQISASAVTVCGTGAVTPTDVHFPVQTATTLESVEGMLVRLPQTMHVTEHFQLGRFGQVTVSSDGRLQQPTNVAAPGVAAAQLQATNNLSRIIVDDASQAQNVDPILFGRGGEPLSAANTLRGGDTATGIVGVMTYTWGGHSSSGNAYRVRPGNALGGSVEFTAANARPAAAPAVGGSLRVAGMNVLNYFNTFSGCTHGVGGKVTDCRGAENATEFDRQWPKTVAAINGTGASVVGVVEIENDGYGPASAIATLVDQLNAATAPGTWTYVDVDARTGQLNALGTDAIKVGAIYKSAVVTPVGRTAALNTTSFVTGGDPAERNRPALAQAFRENATGGVFTAVVNHLKSKGSACTAPDANDGQGNCNTVRVNAATELAAWLATDPTRTGDKDTLILGDLNSYAKEDPITALETAGYTNLIADRVGKEAYSYAFDGQWGYLDHALGSASMAAQVKGVADWHINADEPAVLDYNTNFKSTSQLTSLYAPDQFRVSDHDPVIVGLGLTSDSAGIATGGGWITSPAGALVADPAAAGRGEFQLSAKYVSGTTTPDGALSFDLDAADLAVQSVSVDWMIRSGSTIRLGGVATVNGQSGHRFEVTTTDGGTKADTFRLVVLDARYAVVYDSGSQPVKGQVTVHD